MTDQPVTSPVQPDTSGQQVSTAPTTTGGVDWEQRYKGTGPVINKLTTDNNTLQAQIATLTSQLEQAKAQVGLKDVEKLAAVGERDKQLQQLIEAQTQSTAELARLKALELKLKVAKKLGKPELMEIADTIPSVTDEAALEQLMSSVAEWGDKQVLQREKQIMSGVTPGVSSTPAAPTTPSTQEAWQAHVNSLPVGSPERKKAMDAWWSWGIASQK